MKYSSMCLRTVYLWLGACVLLTGCAIPLVQDAPGAAVEHRQLVKNYSIGASKTVAVGEPMIKFQDFWVETSDAPVATVQRSVTFKGGPAEERFVPNVKYPVRGKLNFEGALYDVVAFNNSPNDYRAALVRPDGSFLNRLAATNPQLSGMVVMIYTFDISDPTVKVSREKIQNTKTAKGYQNFELLYTGTNSSGLNITYREFSPDGFARVAFFQNLTYESNARTISFQKYKIAIHKATSDDITFTVISDGN